MRTRLIRSYEEINSPIRSVPVSLTSGCSQQGKPDGVFVFMELNFGKFKGWEIDEIPTSYLAFLLEATYVTDEIKNECLAEINYRYGYEGDKPNLINKNLINLIYKKLTLKHHPDKGGHHYAMIALNEFRESLLNEI